MTDDEGGELSAVVRPAPLEERRPQGKLQRHAGMGYEIAQSLDVPVLQMVEEPLNVTQFFAAQLPVVAEPVIEVPKILTDRVPQRIMERRPPQMAEQLVEVPTILSFISLQQQTTEQIVDIPVPGRELEGLQGSLPRQNSAALFPWNRTVDHPTGGGLQDFQPVQSSAASSSVSHGHAGQGFFFSPLRVLVMPADAQFYHWNRHTGMTSLSAS